MIELQFVVAQLVVPVNVEAVVILFQIGLEGIPAFVGYAVDDAFSGEAGDEFGQTVGHEIQFFLGFGGNDGLGDAFADGVRFGIHAAWPGYGWRC